MCPFDASILETLQQLQWSAEAFSPRVDAELPLADELEAIGTAVAPEGAVFNKFAQTLELVKRLLVRLSFEVRGLQALYKPLLAGFVLTNDLQRLESVKNRWNDRPQDAFLNAQRTVISLSGDIKVCIEYNVSTLSLCSREIKLPSGARDRLRCT